MNCCKNTYFSAAKTNPASGANAAISLSRRERYCTCTVQKGKGSETASPEKGNLIQDPPRYLSLLADMPPLSHWPDRSLAYDDDRSEVFAHIRERFDVSMDLAGRIFRYANYKKVIRFNRDTKLWCDVEGGSA